jgi:hypothetical protein
MHGQVAAQRPLHVCTYGLEVLNSERVLGMQAERDFDQCFTHMAM